MRRKTVSLFLALTMIFTAAGIPVFSENAATDLSATISDETQSDEIISTLNEENETEPTSSPETTPDAESGTTPETTPESTTETTPEVDPTSTPEADSKEDDATDITEKLNDGAYTIDEDGKYAVSTLETTNYIVVKAGVKAELTITDVKITATNAAPIKIESGASLTLHIKGENTLTAASDYYAGIAVYANDTTSDYGTLVIDGDGSLEVTGALHGAGIGSNKKNTDTSTGISGKITIESGTVKAKGGNGGAGIGTAYNNLVAIDCCDITINGGIVTAVGGNQAAGIGGGGAKNANGTIIINGGYVKATGGTGVSGIGPGKNGVTNSAGKVYINGGSVDATVSAKCPPTDQFGAEVKQITLTMPSSANAANKLVEVDSWSATTDSDGKLYPYVTDDVTTYAVKYNNKIYWTADIESGEPLTEYTGPDCSCTEENSYVTLDKPDSIITVNKLEGYNYEKLVTTFHSEDCTYPLHPITVSYSITDTDGNSVDSSLAQISGGCLYAYFAAAGETINLSANVTMNGNHYTVNKNIYIEGDNAAKFDISKSSIEVTKNSSDSSKINVAYDSKTYTLSKDECIYINQSNNNKTTSNTISVNGVDAKISISNVNISTVLTHPITIGEEVNLDLSLEGKNIIYSSNESAIDGFYNSSTLTISGDGSLDTTSGVGAGIGNIKTLTVNGGTIRATGGNGGAGIGGSTDGAGIEVIINNGRVYATGDDLAAGIGGGASTTEGEGGKFTINGGMVEATGGGSGIGNGGNKNKPGTITVNGGSVKATLAKRPTANSKNQYLVKTKIEGISGQTDVTYKITDDDSDPIPTSTDENGMLYLYMNAGKQWIRVFKDGKTYYRWIKITANDNNEITCIANPVANLKSFEISGQIGETEIDNTNLTVTVTVPYNIMMSSITPIVSYDGSEATTLMDFENETNTAVFTVYSDKKESKEYTVTLKKANQPETPQPDEYDISLGSVIIFGDHVEYGGTSYKTNDDLGYIIKGTTDSNTLTLDYSEEKLPPITLKDLSIESKTQAIPFQTYVSADINVEGTCSFVSSESNTMVFANDYSFEDGIQVNFTTDDGTGKMYIQGNKEAAALIGSLASVSITGIPAQITCDEGYNALSGDGSFTTDSDTAMRIDSASNPEIQPRSTDGTPLYQLKANIKADDKSYTTCVYNEKTYYVWDDATLYLMVPNGEYDMSVTYGDVIYIGKTEINNSTSEVDLYTTKVTSISYDNSMREYTGGTVDFVVEGTCVADKVIIRLKPSNSKLSVLEETVKETEVDGEKINKASITLPQNDSYEEYVTYTVYYVIDDEETELSKKILVNRNDTICRITGFTMPNQVGETNITETDDYNTISIYLPYDTVFEDQKRFTPSSISYIGKGVSPEAEVPTQFTLDVNGYMRKKFYTVTAKNGTTTADYEVRLYKNPTPQIKSLSFKNPTSPNGGTVTVTARGQSTNYIQYAENEENRKVYIYYDGIEPVEATMQMENGIAVYVAEITLPANPSSTQEAEYVLKAKIGDTEQTNINESLATVKVPRQERSLTGISSFTIENQLGDTVMNGTNITLTMPYDADVTAITPSIVLEDMYASYLPVTEQDFTNDVTYTVTAENGSDKTEYTVHVEKQAAPVAESIEFTDPKYSSAGRIFVKINGQNLDNAFDAINVPKTIVVSGELISGDTSKSAVTSANASKNEDGDYVAAIVVPQNNSNDIRKYELSVKIGDTVQTLTGNTTLTVPAKEADAKELSDIIIAEEQSEITSNKTDDVTDLYFYVPYNTDLRNIVPQIFYSGVSCSPSPDEAQDFNEVVTYRVTAQNDTYNDYRIHATRSGAAKIDSFNISKPKLFNDNQVTIDLTGQFVPNEPVNDVIKITAVRRDDETDFIEGTVDYDESVYGGQATGHLTFPVNDTLFDRVYDVKITINGIEQPLGAAGTVTMPRRTTRRITDFTVNGQIGSTQITEIDDNSGSILFTMPYNTDLTALTPRVTIDGDSYTPTTAQDFDKKSVTYTVSADGDTDRTYTVSAQRDGLPSISSVKVSNAPDTFAGKTVTVDVEGTFFYDMKVKAVPTDGSEEIEGTVTMDSWHKASATIDIPTNYDTTADKEYTLVFHLDNFEDEIKYSTPVKITVPRRKTRAITNFMITNQVGVATITDTDVYVKVQYNTNIRELTPTLVIDGDSYTPEGTQSFDNETKSLVFKISAADDEDREYTVHVSRDGKPTISKLTYVSPSNFKGGSIVANFEGIFFESAEVYAVAVDDGTRIEGTVTSFKEGKATAAITIPINYDTENAKEYQLRFVIDGMLTSYIGGTDIVVPRRTTREITEFTLPDVQEGETRIDGTSIYINVPYHLDITSVTPQLTYDADKITPTTAQDFSDLDNPVKYTLSSSGDEDVTYTVYITRIGEDPYIKSLTVDGQATETVYDGDNISLTLKSSASLKEVEPIIDFVGTDYSPKGPQNFTDSEKKDPIVYTVVNEYGIEHQYYVRINKKKSGGGGGSNVVATPTPTPTTEPTPTPTVEPTQEPTPTPELTVVKPYMSGYDEDGVQLFKPDNTITRAEVAKIFSVLDEDFDENQVYENTFEDVGEDTWYRNYMNFAVSKGYISGYEDGTSRPENMITRAEFASMAARYADISAADGEDKFSDIAQYEWCRGQINALSDLGYVSGYEDGTFRPDNMITRAEAVAIINRILGREMTEEISDELECTFDDVRQSHWAYNDILLAACEYYEETVEEN
jgi:hypothetical protein